MQIGLIGLQRACSYCVQIINPENKTINNLKLVTPKVSSEVFLPKSCVRSTEVPSINLSNPIRRHFVNPKFFLNDFDKLSDEINLEGLNVISGYGLNYSKSRLHHSYETHQSWGPSDFHILHGIPLRNVCPKRFSSTLSINMDATPGNEWLNDSIKIKSKFCHRSLGHLMDKEYRFVNFELSDQHVLEFWSRIWEINSKPMGSDLDLTLISSDQTFFRPIQVVKVRREDREMYCVFGIVLVYWLVSNIVELKKCR